MTARTRWAFGENVTFKDGWTKTWEGDVWLKDIGPTQPDFWYRVAIHVPPQRGGTYQVTWYKSEKTGRRRLRDEGVVGTRRTLTEAKKLGNRYITWAKRWGIKPRKTTKTAR